MRRIFAQLFAFQRVLVGLAARQQYGVDQLFKMALGDRAVAVAGANYLTLFGNLDPPLDRARRLCQDGPIGGPAAATDRAASPVKQCQFYVVGAAGSGQSLLRLIERPARPQEAAILVGVAVTDHDFLAIAPLRQMSAVDRRFEKRTHYLGRSDKVIDRLKERRNVQLAEQTGVLRQQSTSNTWLTEVVMLMM